MRFSRMVLATAALGIITALAVAAPALAAGPVQTNSHHQKPPPKNNMPEVPYAALLPMAGVGATVLLLRRRARVD